MTSMEKLMKALEALKIIHTPSAEEDLSKKKDVLATPKDKVLHCSAVADAICSSNLRSSSDFPKVLGLAMESFLVCCDDNNSDVRLMADECLNRTIKSLLDSHLGRLLVELFKEIKKNGSPRSLRAALSRFGDICHLMRPQKCRPYTVNLIPALTKVCHRKEDESVQETLAMAISKLMPVLGQFTNDKDIKALLKAFLPNLTVNSPMVRRAAATSLTSICQNSRRPSTFYSWMLLAMFDLILPIQEERPICVILGVLLCLRHIIPHINDIKLISNSKNSVNILQTDEDLGVTKDQLLKVYEITLHFCDHGDHNVVTATLEALSQLLKCAPKELHLALASPGFVPTSSIYDVPNLIRAMSESQCSIVPSIVSLDESLLDDDQDLYLLSRNVDTKLCESQYSTTTSFDQNISSSYDIRDIDAESVCSNLKKPELQNYESVYEVPKLKKRASDEYTLDMEDELWSTSTTTSPDPLLKFEYKVGNIGLFTDSDIPLKFCSRLISSSFLLSGIPGACIPDQSVRVSVKSLALGCLSSIFSLYPTAFFLPLHMLNDVEDAKKSDDIQHIWDVVIFSTHSDPHIRGQTAYMIGQFIGHALQEAELHWDKWLTNLLNAGISCFGSPTFSSLISKLMDVLKDESSIASKLALIGLQQCLPNVLNSTDAKECYIIIETLLNLGHNSYWLFKVELASLVSSIPFKSLYHLEKSRVMSSLSLRRDSYQEQILNKIIIPLLGDEDGRVRQAAAVACTKLVSKLFFPLNQANEDPVIAIAHKVMDINLNLHQKFYQCTTLPLVHGLVKPFSVVPSISSHSVIDSSLSKIISLLAASLKMTPNKYLMYGCCHALCLLADKFEVTLFLDSWTAFISTLNETEFYEISDDKHYFQSEHNERNLCNSTLSCSDLLCHLISLYTSTSMCLDLVAHQHALQLSGNLLSGAWYQMLGDTKQNITLCNSNKQRNELVVSIASKIFLHSIKLLNIYTHVIEDQNPVPISSRSTLPSLASSSSLSPIKKKKNNKEELSIAGTNLLKSSPTKNIDKIDSPKEHSVLGKIVGTNGLFYTCPLYMKLYEILRGAYMSYKISMDFHSSEKFFLLLRCALDLLCQILEISDHIEIGKSAEELLCYLKVVMTLESNSAVKCVRQLLKCLFATNLFSLSKDAMLIGGNSQVSDVSSKLPTALYDIVISHSYIGFTHNLAEKTLRGFDRECELVSFRCLKWMKRGNEKLMSNIKSVTKGEKSNFASHIRLFEAVVIRALQQYTVSSDIKLQCQVLDLLAQLVQLRVNYCLLDADQIFISHVIKQFEFIEAGQVLYADILIPKIFFFLILLSYERYHSKPIISVPRILQLCDGLIASGQPPEKFVVPALQPVVEDLFLLRGLNKMDLSKELDAQREVVISTVFKLVQFPQVLEFCYIIVCHSHQEGDDKWKKTSRQVVDVILPLLARQQIQLDNQVQLNTLHKLLDVVTTNVFRPVDILLKALFMPPKDLNASLYFTRWMSMVLTVLRILLITIANEEAILSRLADMNISIKVQKMGISTSLRSEIDYSESFTQDSSDSLSAIVFSRFLFQVLGTIVEAISNQCYKSAVKISENTFLCQQAAHFLLYITHMLQSGLFRRVTAAAMSILKDTKSNYQNSMYYSITEIENLFHKISPFHPTLVIQWCNILTLLNYDKQRFWSEIVNPLNENASCVFIEKVDIQPFPENQFMQSNILKNILSCNFEMVHRGGIVLLCDYVYENPTDVVLMTWLIVNHVNEIIELSKETTVQDFMSSIHRNSAASGLWIQAVINNLGYSPSKPTFWKQSLQCLECMHLSQTKKLIILIIDNFVSTHYLSITSMAQLILCRKLDLLIDESIYDINFTVQDVDDILQKLKVLELSHRLRSFNSKCLEFKRLLQYSQNNSGTPTSNHPLLIKEKLTDNVELNKEWFLKFVKKQCFISSSLPEVCASMLSYLKYEEIISVMQSENFNLIIVQKCLTYGARMLVESEKFPSARSNDPFIGVTESHGSVLYRSAQSILLQKLKNFIRLHNPLDKLVIPSINNNFWKVVSSMAPCLICYIDSFEYLLEKNIPQEHCDDIVHFCVAFFQAVSQNIEMDTVISIEWLHLSLVLFDKCLQNKDISLTICSNSHTSGMFSIVSSVYAIFKFLQHDYRVSSTVAVPENLLRLSERNLAQNACIIMTELICWIENTWTLCSSNLNPVFVLLQSIIRGLARLPSINAFVRFPPILWQIGCNPELYGEFKSLITPPPGEYLQDRDVLKEFIFRINFLGWISRQQFEETWMALLGVLSTTPIDNIESKEEDQERIKTSCLAVKSITSLLLQTLLLPQPGNPQNSFFLSHPRDKILSFQHSKCGKQLMAVRMPVHYGLQTLLSFNRIDDNVLNINSERFTTPQLYSISQVSLEYLNAAVGFLEDNEDVEGSGSSNSSPLSGNFGRIINFQQREQYLSSVGLDIHSCLHFLLDLYSQWLSAQTCFSTPLMLLTEVTKSIIALSDIFMEKAQFEWMLDTFLELQRVHPTEDEIMSQYLIFGICKAAAVLGAETDILENIKRLVEVSLKSTYLPLRISTLHGLLYLLEQSSREEVKLFKSSKFQPLLNTVIEYIESHFEDLILPKLNDNDEKLIWDNSEEEEHMITLWAITFYIVENFQELCEDEFLHKIFQICSSFISLNEQQDISCTVYLTILHGLERLLIAEILPGNEANCLLKLASEKIRFGTPIFSMAALGFFISCLYIGKNTNMWSTEILPDSSKTPERMLSNSKQIDTEFLLMAMERITVLFDRIKRSCSFEAKILSDILPQFLLEFFPVQEILNKIISEFLSSQQPHPQLLAKVVFEVFQFLHKQAKQDVIHEWVLLSLCNILQRSPVNMAVWSLNCFFISASANYWFQALFPYVQSRMGKMEKEDIDLLHTAGANFRDELSSEEQKQAYLKTIQPFALHDSPFFDLYNVL